MAGSSTRWRQELLDGDLALELAVPGEHARAPSPLCRAAAAARNGSRERLRARAGCRMCSSRLGRSVYRRPVRGGGWRDGASTRRDAPPGGARRPRLCPTPAGRATPLRGGFGRDRARSHRGRRGRRRGVCGGVRHRYVAGSGSEAEGEPAGTVTRGLTGSAGTLRAGESVTIPRVRPMPTSPGCARRPRRPRRAPPRRRPTRAGRRRAESVADAHSVAHARSERRGGWLLDPVARAFQATRKGGSRPVALG